MANISNDNVDEKSAKEEYHDDDDDFNVLKDWRKMGIKSLQRMGMAKCLL